MSSGFATQHLHWHTKLEQQVLSQYTHKLVSYNRFFFFWKCQLEYICTEYRSRYGTKKKNPKNITAMLRPELD